MANKRCGNCIWAKKLEFNKIRCKNKECVWRSKEMSIDAHACNFWKNT